MSELWVYGAIPPQPAGGVSTFVERLVNSQLGTMIEGVIDPYPGKKNSIPTKHVTLSAGGPIARWRVLAYLWKIKNKPLLINASRPKAAFFLWPFLIGRRAETLLILHHGNLSLPNSRLTRWFLRIALQRYARVGCLSEGQRGFFEALNLPADRLEIVDCYLPPVSAGANVENYPLKGAVDWIQASSLPLVIASGYGEKYYNHDWVISAIESDPGLEEARLLLCCYGPRTELLNQLERRASRSTRIHYIYGLSPADFEYVLSMCDIYARPTEVDSFGIALWDAAALGKRIVASDVCQRPGKALLHPAGDRSAFVARLTEALKDVASDCMTDSNDASELKENRISLSRFLGLRNIDLRNSK